MTAGGDTLGFTYDSLKRLDKRKSPVLDIAYDYRNIDSNTTTTQIASMQYLKQGTTTEALPTLNYTYDDRGNIKKVQSGDGAATEYTYDAQNQLLTEETEEGRSTYNYDTYGNIRSIRREDADGSTEGSYVFAYLNEEWLDLLTGVSYTDSSGETVSGNITYDAVGNPLIYFNGHANWNFTWKYGRQLSSATDGTKTIAYSYDVDGIRESKTVDGVEHTYVTLDGMVIRETCGNVTIDYIYDNAGNPYKIVVDENGTVYTGYFALNQQGDVIALLDTSGKVAVEYDYNAWGNPEVPICIGTIGSKLNQYNALRYRGYYYDAETGLYYLNSRYYDPVVGRFISADTTDVLGVSSDFYDKNLYAYCDNNPVARTDSDGECWHVAIGAVIGGAFEIGSQLLANGGNLSDIHWGKVAVATAVGGITAATGVRLGAAISGVGNGIMEVMSGTKSIKKIVTSVAVGAGASLVGSGTGKIVEKIGGKMAVKSLAKKSPGVIKKTVLSKINVKGADRNAIKNLSWVVSKYKNLPSALLGRNIPQAFNSFAVGISGYGTMGAIYGFK